MLLLRPKLNKTKTKALITLVAVLLVATPVYFASAEGLIDDIVYNLVMFLFGGLVGLCGAVLNYAVQNFVVNFAYEFNSPSLNNTINILWTLIRDIFNMTFIFGLVYIGFTMILKSDTSSTRKWLINLVIAALLVNFSLLISKLVIDATNLTATQILNAGLNNQPLPIFTRDNENKVDFAGSMMDQLGLTSLFRSKSKEWIQAEQLSGQVVKPADNSFGYSMMLMLLFLITSFVFLSAGIMIIIRGAMLVLFMIFSPLMFIGFVLPGLMSTTKRYWKEFISRALFAPVYILLVYVGMSIFQAVQIQGGRTSANGSNLTSAFNPNGFGDAGTVSSTFGPFALFIVLMVASLSIAKKLGAEGASSAMGSGKFLIKKVAPRAAGRATAGTAAFVGRNTVGRGASVLASSKTFQKWAAGNVVARQALKATRGAADGNYDIRNIGVVKMAAKSAGIDIGKGAKGGFDTRKKKRQKSSADFMESLDKIDMKDPKNLARAKQKAGKIKADAQKNIARLRALQAALNADKDKNNVALKKEINDLATAIKSDKSKLKDKTLSVDKKNELKDKIALNQELVKQKETLTKRNKQSGDLRNDLMRAKAEEENQKRTVASLAGDPARVTEYEAAQIELNKLRDNRAQAEAKLEKVDKLILETREEELEMERDSLSKFDTYVDPSDPKFKEKSDARESAANAHAEKIARAEVEYGTRLKYLAERERDANSFIGIFKTASIPGFTNVERQDAVDNLKKKFGGNAEEMGRKSKAFKEAKDREAARKAADKEAGLDGDDKKDDKKDAEDGDDA